MYENYTNDDSISPEDAKLIEEGEKEYYSKATFFTWRGKTIMNDPSLVVVCKDDYNKYLNDIIGPIDRSASTDKEAFEMLYATQGYTKEELEEDMKHPNFAEFLSNIICMDIQDAWYKEISDERDM